MCHNYLMRKRPTKKKKSSISVSAVALAIAAPLFVYALVLVPPAMLAHNVRAALTATAVGASAGVDPNPINTLAAQLKDKETSLDQREQVLSQLENEIIAKNSSNNTIAFISLGGSLLLFLLVGLNFYLDTKRRRDQKAAPGRFAIDLKRLG